MENSFETQSPEETEAVGYVLAGLIPRGTLVALQGELAAGKTCLVRGMARHFDDGAPVHSPTFTLVNQYGEVQPLYHLDLYRLGGAEELADLGYEELFDADGLCVVEWPERADGLLPSERVHITIVHGGGDRRHFHVASYGVRLPEDWFSRILASLTNPVA